MSVMKKSMMYRLAAIAVLKDEDLDYNDTIDIVRELGDCEKLARYSEEKEAQRLNDY